MWVRVEQLKSIKGDEITKKFQKFQKFSLILLFTISLSSLDILHQVNCLKSSPHQINRIVDYHRNFVSWQQVPVSSPLNLASHSSLWLKRQKIHIHNHLHQSYRNEWHSVNLQQFKLFKRRLISYKFNVWEKTLNTSCCQSSQELLAIHRRRLPLYFFFAAKNYCWKHTLYYKCFSLISPSIYTIKSWVSAWGDLLNNNTIWYKFYIYIERVQIQSLSRASYTFISRRVWQNNLSIHNCLKSNAKWIAR
jgi:hypothetical protein